MWKLAFVLLLTSLLSAQRAAADVAAVLADPQRSEADRTRDGHDHPAAILELAGVAPGMRILDLFAGSGYYSELLGTAVGPEGAVLLHNNRAYLGFAGDDLAARQRAGLPGSVTRLDAEADALGLEPESLDGVFMIMVFHDFWYRSDGWAVSAEQVLPQLHRALRPGGFVLIVDHAADPGTGTGMAQTLHRIDEDAVKSTMARYGFELDKRSDVLRNPQDTRVLTVFDPAIRGRTDRFVHRYHTLPDDGEGTGI